MRGKQIKKIAVLMGGLSSERKISLLTGREVVSSLKKLGYVVQSVLVSSDLLGWVQQLQSFKPDVVFNALHGKYGEDGCVQGILNFLHIPYTHSGVLASALGMDKEQTRQIAKKLGLLVAGGGLKTLSQFQQMTLPVVVKPNNEGSSCGVQIILTETDRKRMAGEWPVSQKLLVERYIAGRELSVAVLNGRALSTVELCVKNGWYDYKNKYQKGAVIHKVPAPVSVRVQHLMKRQAEIMHQALGCRGVTRCDFRLSPTGRLYFLEINTNPGMTPTSLVPDMARFRNMSYDEVVEQLIRGAQCD